MSDKVWRWVAAVGGMIGGGVLGSNTDWMWAMRLWLFLLMPVGLATYTAQVVLRRHSAEMFTLLRTTLLSPVQLLAYFMRPVVEQLAEFWWAVGGLLLGWAAVYTVRVVNGLSFIMWQNCRSGVSPPVVFSLTCDSTDIAITLAAVRLAMIHIGIVVGIGLVMLLFIGALGLVAGLILPSVPWAMSITSVVTLIAGGRVLLRTFHFFRDDLVFYNSDAMQQVHVIRDLEPLVWHAPLLFGLLALAAAGYIGAVLIITR